MTIRLTPKAARDRIDGLMPIADGGTALKVAVTAAPEDGRANDALLRLLAKEWKLPRRDLDLVQGMTDRRKVVRVSGDSQALMMSFKDWQEKQHG